MDEITEILSEITRLERELVALKVGLVFDAIQFVVAIGFALYITLTWKQWRGKSGEVIIATDMFKVTGMMAIFVYYILVRAILEMLEAGTVKLFYLFIT